MFWIIFGTASFTTLIVSWAVMILFARSAEKASNKSGLCYVCGAPHTAKLKEKKTRPLGFKK